MNMLFLSCMFDQVPDTRTPARLTAVAEHCGAELDFNDPKTKDFVALLVAKAHHGGPDASALREPDSRPRRRDGDRLQAHRGPAAAGRAPSGLLEGGLPVTGDKEKRYQDSFAAMLHMLTVLHDAGVPIVAGTDSSGFSLIRELELYVKAGIPAPEVLQMATLGAARAAGQGRTPRLDHARQAAQTSSSWTGDPSADPGALRNLRLVVKDGVPIDPRRCGASSGSCRCRSEDGAACLARAQASRFRNSVMISAFAKSMKNAPTIGATRSARRGTVALGQRAHDGPSRSPSCPA